MITTLNLSANHLVERIVSTTADAYRVPVDEVLSARREGPLVRARHVGMYVTRQMTDLSLPKIARRFNRDHTTVMHALDRVRNDPKLLDEANQLIAHLSQGELDF